MSHSPGPWRWSGEHEWRLRSAAGHTVLRANADASPADAALVAAAPEMLELLRFFVSMVSAEPVHPKVYQSMKLLERLK